MGGNREKKISNRKKESNVVWFVMPWKTIESDYSPESCPFTKTCREWPVDCTISVGSSPPRRNDSDEAMSTLQTQKISLILVKLYHKGKILHSYPSFIFINAEFIAFLFLQLYLVILKHEWWEAVEAGGSLAIFSLPSCIPEIISRISCYIDLLQQTNSRESWAVIHWS